MLLNESELTILLVEDNLGHARLVEKNLRRSNVKSEIVVLEDGGLALDYLLGDGATIRLRTPHLILLDLNLPVVDGYQVLRQLKANASTRQIPVVVLTTTDDPHEVARCYEMGCNAYISKPVDYGKLSEALYKLGLFLSIVSIPE